MDPACPPETTEENDGALPPGINSGDAKLRGDGEVKVSGQGSDGSNPSGTISLSGIISLFG